jgi:conjugative transfer pilus assembly protein TraH
MTTRSKRLVAGLLAAILATAPVASHPANLNAEMQAMFNELGVLGNVTEPGAFRGQAMNLYVGGSLMMRTPGRNYPLADVQLPSLRAGCGGIDLFGGAFSFINKQQFVALLQNIGSNAVGYAFKLALQSISPDIDKLLTELQDQINKINAMSINSCEAAQAVVNGAFGAYDNSMMSGCQNISQYLGSVTDRVDGRLVCATAAPSVVKAAAVSADPNVRNATFVQGNIVWTALNQIGGGISREEKELVMSVIGTMVLYPPQDNGAGAMPRHYPPTIVGLRDLLLGRAAAAGGNVEIEVYVCDEPVECMRPSRSVVVVKPFSQLVAERLLRMSANIATRMPHTAADIGFVNNTSEPVYRMLAVANAVPGSNTAETLIATYQDVIAVDYAETFMSRVIRQALAGLSQTLKRSGIEEEYIETLKRSAQEIQQQLIAEKQSAYSKVRSVSAMTQDLQTLERQLWGAMPSGLKAMLDFGSAARGS